MIIFVREPTYRKIFITRLCKMDLIYERTALAAGNRIFRQNNKK